MNDQILHALIFDGNAAMLMINASDATDEAKKLLNLSDGVTCALGRLFCAGAMLAQRNKSESEKLTLILSGGGPAGKLLVPMFPTRADFNKTFPLPRLRGRTDNLRLSGITPRANPMLGYAILFREI